eukprot:1716932-Prymnesium_polylepis.2
MRTNGTRASLPIAFHRSPTSFITSVGAAAGCCTHTSFRISATKHAYAFAGPLGAFGSAALAALASLAAAFALAASAFASAFAALASSLAAASFALAASRAARCSSRTRAAVAFSSSFALRAASFAASRSCLLAPGGAAPGTAAPGGGGAARERSWYTARWKSISFTRGWLSAQPWPLSRQPSPRLFWYGSHVAARSRSASRSEASRRGTSSWKTSPGLALWLMPSPRHSLPATLITAARLFGVSCRTRKARSASSSSGTSCRLARSSAVSGACEAIDCSGVGGACAAAGCSGGVWEAISCSGKGGAFEGGGDWTFGLAAACEAAGVSGCAAVDGGGAAGSSAAGC